MKKRPLGSDHTKWSVVAERQFYGTYGTILQDLTGRSDHALSIINETGYTRRFESYKLLLNSTKI